MGLNGSDDDHDSIVERSGCLLDVLSGSSSDDHGHSLGRCAFSEEIESIISELFLLELATGPEGIVSDAVGGGLDGGTSSLAHSLKVILRDSASAEDIPIGKVLSCKISNRQS